MPNLDIRMEGDNAWPDLAVRQGDIINVTDTLGVTFLEGGMQSGAGSVAIRLDLPDGKVVIAETSWALFAMAARAFGARYGWPDGWEANWSAYESTGGPGLS